MKKIILILFLILSGCKSSDEDVESIVKENNSKWVQYYNSGDAKAIASLHTVDAVVIPPKADFIIGRENIKQMYQAEIEMGRGKLELSTKEVIQDGLFAFETGLYSIKMTIEGEELNDYGKYIVIWERQGDGNWLCKKDIWNTSLTD